MSVREASLSDVDLIAPLFDAYRVFYEETSDLDAARACIRENLTLGRSTIFIFIDGREVLGFTQLYPAFCSVAMKPFYILYDIYVLAEARERGIGCTLLQHAHTWAREQGAFRIDLETAHTNIRAQSIYEKLGYELDTTFRKYSLDVVST